MENLTIDQIIAKINRKERFNAVAADYSFTLKIDEYVPYICAAVHDGHQFRKELWQHCTHSAYERWFEEDPCTKTIIQSQPIVIAGLDSRFEYDLNRDPEHAIYEDAWGKPLWITPLSAEMKAKSRAKHHAFYRVVHALVAVLEAQFNRCLVFDMHSYNWQRWDREVPTWNLGTANVDQTRYHVAIEHWRMMLDALFLPNNIKNDAKINDTFQGNGYFLKYISQQFKNTLVLATELKKIYCDELSQRIYPDVVHCIESYLKQTITLQVTFFCESEL